MTAAKDQTYALYNLTQEQLEHTLMPVGEYSKDQIREMAEKDRTSGGTQTRQSGYLFCSGWTIMHLLLKSTVRKIRAGRQFRDTRWNVVGLTKESSIIQSDREKDLDFLWESGICTGDTSGDQ